MIRTQATKRTARRAFRDAVGRDPRRLGEIKVQVQSKGALDSAALYQYWHPERTGAEACPASFAAQIASVHPDLAICRPPGRAPVQSRPWLVWYRKASVTHALCPGWTLLFCWQTQERVPLPLDNRIFANLYRISAHTFGSAVAYFQSIVSEMERGKASEAKAQEAYRHDRAHDFFQATKIKNIGRGNKFALHHDGTIIPSRGEANWTAERMGSLLPGSVLKEQREARERQRG